MVEPRSSVTLQAPPILVPVHNLTRYLRCRLEVSGGVMRWETPRALLGLVPVGVRRVAVPVDEVLSIDLGRAVRPIHLTVGLALIATPAILGLWWLLAPLGLLGLWVGLVSMGPAMVAVTRNGERHRADVCFGHQIDADLYMEIVRDLASGGSDVENA